MLVMIDLDNTLADRERAVHEWIDEFCTELDLPADAPARILAAERDGYAKRSDVFTSLRDEFGLSPSVLELLAAYQRRIVELVTPCDGALDFLDAARRRGWSTAIVTNGSAGQQHGKVERLGLRDRVDAVIVSDDIGVAKPDRRIFEAAATAAGASLADAWMIGDSARHDIEGAASLGVRTVWLDRGRRWSDQGDAVQPDIITDTLVGLDETISQHATSG